MEEEERRATTKGERKWCLSVSDTHVQSRFIWTSKAETGGELDQRWEEEVSSTRTCWLCFAPSFLHSAQFSSSFSPQSLSGRLPTTAISHGRKRFL